jgi:2-dehydropantoate 2-reductase
MSLPPDATATAAAAAAALTQPAPPAEPVVIVGAGALGCLLAARLARAGQPVLLLGRAAQVQALTASGLALRDDAGQQVLKAPATTDIGAVAGASLVVLCVKSTDTEGAARQMAPWLAPHTPLLSLQNGVANGPLLASLLGRPVLVGAAYIAASLQAPGVVQHAGGRGIVLGVVPGPQGQWLTERTAHHVAQGLQAAGFDVRLSATPLAELWRKLVVNCACNAISALAQAPYGAMARVAAVRDLQVAVVAEAVAVAQAEGHALVLDEMMAAVDRVAQTMAGQRSSTAQDLARGRRSEIDHLNGEVLRAGARHGIATPANQALWALVKLHEALQQPGL